MLLISDLLKLLIVIATLLVYNAFYFKKMGLKQGLRKLNAKYLFSIIFVILTGLAIYIGIMYVLKAFGITVDTTFEDNVIYSLLAGLVIIFFSLITLKDNILKDLS